MKKQSKLSSPSPGQFSYILKTIFNEGGHATSDDFKNYELIEDNKFNFKYKNLILTGHSGSSIVGLMVLKYL